MQTLNMFLAALAENVGPGLLRVKGIIQVEETPDTPAVVHGAQQLLHGLAWLPQWPSEDRRTRIQFITLDHQKEVIGQLIEDVERFSRRSAATLKRHG